MVQIVTIITCQYTKWCCSVRVWFLYFQLVCCLLCNSARGFVLHFVHKCIAIGYSIIMKKFWNPVTGISPPHLCFCPKPRSRFTPAYVVIVNLLYSLIWGGGISCYWWNSWPSLYKLSFHNVCKRQMSNVKCQNSYSYLLRLFIEKTKTELMQSILGVLIPNINM